MFGATRTAEKAGDTWSGVRLSRWVRKTESRVLCVAGVTWRVMVEK